MSYSDFLTRNSCYQGNAIDMIKFIECIEALLCEECRELLK